MLAVIYGIFLDILPYCFVALHYISPYSPVFPVETLLFPVFPLKCTPYSSIDNPSADAFH